MGPTPSSPPSPPALVPFVQALASSAADSSYDWLRRRLRSGGDISIDCEQEQLVVVLLGELSDDALDELIALDREHLPRPGTLHWDADDRTWRARRHSQSR